MKSSERHITVPGNVSKCPYHTVMSHIWRVRFLFQRILGKETPNVSVAWKWFQDEENLKRMREQMKPIWQKEGIDNRLAFAGLIGCIMPEFTAFIQAEADDFFTMKEAVGYTSGKFQARMDEIKKPTALDSLDQIADFDYKSRVAFSLFLLDVFFLWRWLWNGDVSRKIKKDKDMKIASWKIAFDLCGDVPVQKKDKEKRWKKYIKKEKNILGIAQPIWWWMASFSSEFMRSIERQEIFQGRTLTNEEIEKILPGIHIWLLEIMHEFTGFTFVASHIEGELQKAEPGIQIYERMRSGDISYIADFFKFLEENFMKAYIFLRWKGRFKKDIWTMTCPVTRSHINGRNVVSILSEVLIIPLMHKYYLPWRKKNIPGI